MQIADPAANNAAAPEKHAGKRSAAKIAASRNTRSDPF